MKTYVVIISVDAEAMALLVKAESKVSAVKKAKTFKLGKLLKVYECIQHSNSDANISETLSAVDAKIMQAEEEVRKLREAAFIESSIASYQRYAAAKERLNNLQGLKGEQYA